MKKIILTILIFALIGGFGFAQTTIDSAPFAPMTPEVIGQGGSFNAVSQGYKALFHNPAGFSRGKGSFTLLSVTASPYFVPDEELITELELVSSGDTSDMDSLNSLILDNGFGAAANSGIALVNNGLALAFVGNLDAYGRGDTLMGTTLKMVRDWAFIGGYSVPLNLGPVSLHVGGDLRYMMRAEIPSISAIGMLSSEEEPTFNVYSGAGLGFDMGAIAEMGPWSVGLSFRDIGGTTMDYTYYEGATMDQMGEILNFAPLEGGVPTDDSFVVPMVTSLGVGYDPNGFILPAFLFDPAFHAEYRHTHYQADDAQEYSFWTGVHMGMEVKVLRFLKFRAGINQGYSTFGVGAKLLFLDVNASFFTRETGRYAGVKPNEGLTLEAALRF